MRERSATVRNLAHCTFWVCPHRPLSPSDSQDDVARPRPELPGRASSTSLQVQSRASSKHALVSRRPPGPLLLRFRAAQALYPAASPRTLGHRRIGASAATALLTVPVPIARGNPRAHRTTRCYILAHCSSPEPIELVRGMPTELPSKSNVILVVDDDSVSRRVLKQTLVSAGLESVSLDSAEAALNWLEESVPCLILLDLVMPGVDGYAVLAHVRERRHLVDTPVVVLTALDSEEEIQRIFASGADDYVHKPFRPAELISRVRGQMRLKDYVERLSRREQNAKTVLELTQTLASSLDIRDILFTVAQRIAKVADVDRCSVILVADPDGVGYVVATSDDEGMRDLAIDLRKYPEIRQVLDTGMPLVIRDAVHHPLLEAVRHGDAALEFTSLAIAPISHDGGPLGVIFLRSRGHAAFAEQEMALVRTVSNTAAIALRNARILRDLKAETRQSTRARQEAERRVQLFQRYADFFESAADGMVVIDRVGMILFANPRAREILGFTESELVGTRFENLLVASERPRAQRILRGFSSGIYPRSVDLTVSSGSGAALILSVSFSSVLHEDDAVLFSFRDVTQERETAIELQQTKEFLERVIDSSVDAIVSADTRGVILLFNGAAARLFGYDSASVVGRLNAAALYPSGGARRVLRKILDPHVSGRHRLEGHRVDVVSKSGELIPVSLSAALILEGTRPIGSVGIFTDIREKLRMSERLELAHEELRNREKQAIVAELAGTAAHELNQPLTSVIGYAELLRRNLHEKPHLCNAAGVIISESERMAEIVRKIGRITRWETKNYVGDTKILDLERATSDPDAGTFR